MHPMASADRPPLTKGPSSSDGKARDRVFDAFARGLYAAGVRPNHLTLAQVPIYVLMIVAGLEGRVIEFGLWQIVIMVLDGMDGTLARRMGLASRSGAVLDAVFDFFGIIVVIGIAVHLDPQYFWWFVALLGANFALYLQNGVLDEKAVSYVRGPVVIALVLERSFPGIMWVAILVPLVVALTIVIVRGLVDRVEEVEGELAYRPGFRSDKDRS